MGILQKKKIKFNLNHKSWENEQLKNTYCPCSKSQTSRVFHFKFIDYIFPMGYGCIRTNIQFASKELQDDQDVAGQAVLQGLDDVAEEFIETEDFLPEVFDHISERLRNDKDFI